MAAPAGCNYGNEGSFSWAACSSGSGQYRAWAQCKPSVWWGEWRTVYGQWKSPGQYIYSTADCGSGRVASYGINYR